MITTISTTGTIPYPEIPVNGYIDVKPYPLPRETVSWVFHLETSAKWEKLNQGSKANTLTEAKAWLEVKWAGIDGSYSEARSYSNVPIEEILVSGETRWEGNARQHRTIDLSPEIRLPRDGVWLFQGYFSGRDWSERETLCYEIVIAVVDGVAVNYRYGLEGSALSYLQWFDYGTSSKVPVSESRPIHVELDISKLPRAGEEVVLTYRVSSPFFSIKDFYMRTLIVKKEDKPITIPSSDVLISGELNWTTDIAKGEVIERTAIIKLPETGEWVIQASGSYPGQKSGLSGTTDDIKITINDEKSYYGWEERRTESTIRPTDPTTTTTRPKE